MDEPIFYAEWSKEPAVASSGHCYVYRGNKWVEASFAVFMMDARKMSDEEFHRRFLYLEPSPIERERLGA